MPYFNYTLNFLIMIILPIMLGVGIEYIVYILFIEYMLYAPGLVRD
jgi:hypothetical protein